MICPFCNANDDKVIDSRSTEGGRVIRRRRQCLSCEKRFTTYERVEQASRLMVVKRDGSREPFDRDKVARGVASAFGKRKVSEEKRRRIVDEVEEELHAEFDKEVESGAIGERVLTKLWLLDPVAYIRFKSEYLQFSTLGEIRRAIEDEMQRPQEVRDQKPLFDAPGSNAADRRR